MRRHNNRILRSLGRCMGCLVAVSGLLFSQNPPPQAPANEPDEVPIFRAGTNLKVLHVTVLDKNQKLLTDVPRSAFKIFENGIEQPIKGFQREDIPVSMGIIIDNSG